eukprot:COSAG03_NODE_1063_length_4926_cov_40.714108_2_plen_154_part_00
MPLIFSYKSEKSLCGTGAWTQQSLDGNATTICVPLPTPSAKRSHVPVSFAPQSLWYPGQGPAGAWTGSTPTFSSALSDLETRIRSTEPAGGGQTVFTLVYGLVYAGPGGLDAISASVELSKRLPADRFEVVGAQEMARLSSLHCNGHGHGAAA